LTGKETTKKRERINDRLFTYNILEFGNGIMIFDENWEFVTVV